MRPQPSPIAQQILIAVAALAATSCSSPQSSSSSGSGNATETTGAGTSSSDDPPWEDKIKAGQDREEMLSRDCWPKKSIWEGRPGATPEPSASAAPVAPSAGACPTIADLRALGYTTPSQPTDRTGSVVTEGPVTWNEQCCYLVSHWHTGRPYVLDGAVTSAPEALRSDWSTTSHTPRSAADARLAAAWLRDARLEHASVASFGTFALDLLALGAPRALVEGAHRAALDEIDHARRCFALASRFGGRDVGPGPLPVAGDRSRRPSLSIASVARAALAEGCVGETAAALLAEAMLTEARRAERPDPEVEATLAIVAEDEARHASLAFAFIAWALDQDPTPVRRAIRDTLASLDDVRASLRRAPQDGPKDARIDEAARADVAARATRVVADALASLLALDKRC